MLYGSMPGQFLTHSQQARLLIARGMRSKRGLTTRQLHDVICERLHHISYSRLSQYWNRLYSPQIGTGPRVFAPDTYWEDVVDLYMFDRRLRNLFFDAIARIEISLRAAIGYRWAKVTQNPYAHSRACFCGLSRGYSSKSARRGKGRQSAYDYMMNKADEVFASAKKQGSVAGRRALYADVSSMPVWEFIDFCTFGPLSILLADGLIHAVKLAVAHTFGFADVQEFTSVISLLHSVRNECAHQGRIWNREWKTLKGNPSVKAAHRPEWRLVWDAGRREWVCGQGDALVSDTKKTAVALTYCCLLLQKIAPNSGWKERCRQFLSDEKNQAYIKELGFHPQWESHPFWR